MKKAIIALLTTILAAFGYVAVDKNYVETKEKEISSLNAQVSSLVDVSKEYAVHKCPTTKVQGTKTTTQKENTTNNITSNISWANFYVGMKIPVKVDIKHYPFEPWNQNLVTDYDYEFSNAYAEVTRIPSSTRIEYKINCTVKVTRKSSTYYNNGLTVVLGYDDFCGNKTVESEYVRYTQVACCYGNYGEDGPWINNSITNTASEIGYLDKSNFPDNFSGFVIDALCSCPGNGGDATL